MPTNPKRLDEELAKCTSILSLPLELQSSALEILEHIRRCNLKHVEIRATTLREEARMDPHRYHRIYKWLRRNGYFDVVKGRHKKRRVQFVTITAKGETVLRKRHSLTRLVEITGDLYRSPDLRRKVEMDLVLDLVVEAFDIAYSELYYAGRTDDYEMFTGRLEERLRERLDTNIGDRIGLIHDASLSVRRIPGALLLEDAKLAKERGHFLTENHRYVLNRWEHILKQSLLDHNAQWSKRKMQMKFSGNEPYEVFKAQVDPCIIVEKEREERGTRILPERSAVVWSRDGYDLDERWKLDIGKLELRWRESHSQHS